MVSLSGEKFIFSTALLTTGTLRILKLFVYIHVVLLEKFPENFELLYASTSNIPKDTKFYNAGDKNFETDFSLAQLVVYQAIYD